MIAVIRTLLKVINKEWTLLDRYQRSHRHFFWLMGVDVLLSIAVIVAGFQLATAPSASTVQELSDSGAITLTSSQLVSHTKSDNDFGYWLGPGSGDVFLDNDNESGVDIISYLPRGSRPSDVQTALMTIETYTNAAAFAAEVQSLRNKRIVTAGGDTVQFSTDSMKNEVVTFPDKPRIVAINYSTRQTLQTLIGNAESLRPVQ